MEIIIFFKKLRHLWKLKTSAEYRRQTLLNEGEEIWNRLDAKLPNAEGITNLDRVRLRMFERKVEELSQEERKALYAWLEYKVQEVNKNFTEHTTGMIEEEERKTWQIFESHLEVVFKWLT